MRHVLGLENSKHSIVYFEAFQSRPLICVQLPWFLLSQDMLHVTSNATLFMPNMVRTKNNSCCFGWFSSRKVSAAEQVFFWIFSYIMFDILLLLLTTVDLIQWKICKFKKDDFFKNLRLQTIIDGENNLPLYSARVENINY